MGLGISVLSWLLGGASPTVEGSTACPSPAEVAEAVDALLSGPARRPATEVALLWFEGASLHVTLARRDGVVLAEKSLAPEHSCRETARTAAVVLAAWLGELHASVPL